MTARAAAAVSRQASALSIRLDRGSRHCEERSDEAIQGDWVERLTQPPGLLRFARNDGSF
ncbi:hypothetical protein FQV39_26280 [Bosea sp. F3-2]|nr:hypothetical protein FQV39_26280 [Bosea sp. F3-2]